MYHRKREGLLKVSEGSFLDNNCTVTYPFRRPVFHFVSCSLILPEQHIVISAWCARWIALFLISPFSTPPYLYRIFYRQTKKHIDSSFNRHLFRLLIMLPPHLSPNFPCHLITQGQVIVLSLSLPFDLSPPCLVILCFNFFAIQCYSLDVGCQCVVSASSLAQLQLPYLHYKHSH